MPTSQAKPFDIPKQLVWEAYRQVAANKGAPGVDGQDLEAFGADLKGNLYKIWNRMSSGSYFPPPVRAVEIPKPHGGGARVLGCPRSPHRARSFQVESSFGLDRCYSSVPPAGRPAPGGHLREAPPGAERCSSAREARPGG